MSNTDLSQLAIRYSQAWAKHDPDAIVALHTDDTVFHMHDVTEPASGRDAVRAAIVEIFAQIPDLHFQSRRVLFGDAHFLSEYEMRGTADGRTFACAGVDIFTVRDGLIARKDTYADWLAYQQQVMQTEGAVQV
jgi:steroid delta-isomerase-like uncharacterized protein